MMKKYPILLATSLLISSVFAQETVNYKKEMMKLEGEKNRPILSEFTNSITDYSTFQRTYAWNTRIEQQSIFGNTKELDIPIIGGRVRSTLVDKTTNINLVAPSGGGLWKFNTDGSSFTPINDFGSFLAITSISQNSFNKQQIIIGTGDENHGIVGNGVFVSADGGTTFSQLASTNPMTNSAFQYVRFVKYSPQTQNTIYLTSRGKLYKSTDAGKNWTMVFDAGYNDIRSLEFSAGTGVMIAVEKYGVYKSSTGDNNTFTLLKNGISNDTGTGTTVDNIVLATHGANRNIAYALTEKNSVGKIFKTTDGGTTWTETTSPTFYIAQGWFCLTLGIHPTNPNILIGGSVGWGYSKDGGTTWTVGADLEVDFHDIHFHASDPNVAYIGYDQGLGQVDFSKTGTYWAWNGTKYVQETQIAQKELGKNAGFNTTQIYSGDFFPQEYGDGYLEGQQDGGSFAQVNKIDYRILVGDGGSMFVNKQTPTKAFGSTQKGRLYHTTDALQPSYGDYTELGSFYNNHPNWITQFAGNNADGNQLYMADNTSIQRTINDGTSFSSIASHALKGVKVAVQNATNPIVYAIGYDNSTWNSEIIRIQNAATSPIVTTKKSILTNNIDGTPDQITVSENQGNTIFVTSSRGNAYRVSNLETATPKIESIKGNIKDVIFNVVIDVVGDSNLLIAGTNTGVFYSENSGLTWTLSTQFPYTQVTDLKLRNSDKRLFVFTHGRGAWASTITPTITNTFAEQKITSSIFPNPATDFITIQVNGEFEAILFDEQGRKVATSNSQKMDVKSLTKGLYILHVYTQNSLKITEKIIIK